MKKLFAAMLIAVFALTLTACGDNGEVPDDIVDCIENPSDPECQQAIDCAQNPDDPACEVDCTVDPDDPSCEVDCTVNPDDPTCEVDCVANPNDPACAVDCAVTPDDPSCPLECPTGQEEVDGVCVIIDTRTPAEIAADLIIDNWDGTMDHVDSLMMYMDFSNAITMTTEFNVEVLDGEGVPHALNLTVQDEIANGEYQVIRREVTGVFEGEEFEFILVIEETMTGFIVYYDTSFIRAMIIDEAAVEVQDVLDTLDANGTWFMFKFDDSLENLVELEVLKEMIVAAIYQEFGDDVYAIIEDEINLALGLDLGTYGFMFEDFVELLIDEDFAAAELMINNVNYDQLLLDLDQLHVVPAIIDHFEYFDFYDQEFEISQMIPAISPDGYMYWPSYSEELQTMTLDVMYNDPANFAVLEAQLLALPWVTGVTSSVEVHDPMMMNWSKQIVLDYIPDYELKMLEIDPMWDVDAEILFLQQNGTEAWLNQLTDLEIQNILSAHDPLLGEAYEANLTGELDHWIVMQFLNDPNVQLELANIPGLDVTAFVNTMDMLDYDAWYMEDVDFEALFQAVYDGYAAYDLFVGNLNATSPQSASILAHFGGVDGLVDYLQDYMVIVDDVELGFTNLVMFEDYVTPEYYLSIGLYDYEIEKLDDFDILGTAVVDTSATSQLFQDFINDLYWYLDAFESFDMPYVDVLNCPDLATCETFYEYPEIIEALDQLGLIVITVQYDPLNLDKVEYKIQFSDYVQSIIAIDDPLNASVVEDFSITVTLETAANPVVPDSDITDVNQTIEDFARFSLVMEARNYLENIKYYYEMSMDPMPMVNTPIASIAQYVGASVAFDEELSYFRITGNEIDGYEYELQLFWLDGTAVFTEPLLWSELEAQFGMGTGAPDRADFLLWMEKVDPANFNMTKLFLVYMWDQYADTYYPEPPM